MTEIKVRNYGYDASQKEVVDAVITALDKEFLNDVTLDMCECFMDYPKTGQLVGEVLKRLKPRNKLIIKTHLLHKEETFLRMIFKDTGRIQCDDKVDLAAIKKQLDASLRHDELKIELEVIDFATGNLDERFIYGS